VATQTTIATAQPLADMRWLSRFIGRHKFAAGASLVSGMIGGVTLALEPYVVGIIVDNIRSGVVMSEIWQGILLLLGLALITVIAFFAQRHYSGQVAYAVHYDVRKTVFDNMVTLDRDFYKQYSTGDLISRMFTDMNYIWRLLALTFNRGGNAVSGFLMTIILLGLVDLRLTLLVVVILTISTAFQMRAGLIIIPIFEHVQDQAGKLSELTQDSFSGIQTIKTFGREQDVNRAFYAENEEYRRRWLYFKRRNEPIGLLPQMIAYLTTGIVVLFGGIMTLRGEITIGNFTQFILYLGLISRVLLMLGTIYQRYMQTRGALQRITPLLQSAHIHTEPDAAELRQATGDIVFENVNLQEDGKCLLQDINLHIPGGSVVAIVGATGSGKTVLVNLLSRVSDVSDGRVLIDGQDIRQLKLEDLRDTVAYVPQQTFLFSQTLHENVRMGHAEITDEALERAIHISRMSKDLPQMPQGLETLVGEKGVMLSGGQKQRVAIARAIARDPAILVLDDALSSVDTQTAAEILRDMREVLNTRTSIIIAHRIATVKDADFIVVMDEGLIVEQGTHEELVALNGLYTGMVEREAQQEKDTIHE